MLERWNSMTARPTTTRLETNKAIVRDYYAELDRGNFEIMDEAFAPDLTFHFPGSPPMDRQATMDFVKGAYSAFPDLQHNIEDLIAEGNRVVLRVTAEATHHGEFLGLPGTGKRITITAIGIFRMTDGKMAEIWEEADLAGLTQQITT